MTESKYAARLRARGCVPYKELFEQADSEADALRLYAERLRGANIVNASPDTREQLLKKKVVPCFLLLGSHAHLIDEAFGDWRGPIDVDYATELGFRNGAEALVALTAHRRKKMD